MNEKEVGEVLSRIGNEVVSLMATSRNLGENYAKLVELLSAPLNNDNGSTRKESAGFRDRVILGKFNKDGVLVDTRDSGWHDHECLTNTGFANVAGLLLTDVGGVAYDFCGIGTGAVAADPTDTDLGGLVKRKAGTGTRQTTGPANDTAQLITSFAAADGLAGVDAITESDVMTTAAAGIELCRQVFAALNMDWDAGDTLQVTWRVQAKQGV